MALLKWLILELSLKALKALGNFLKQLYVDHQNKKKVRGEVIEVLGPKPQPRTKEDAQSIADRLNAMPK